MSPVIIDRLGATTLLASGPTRALIMHSKKGMTMADQVGTIEALWRFPVKSMQGEQLDATEVSTSGLAGDRAYALIDATTGKVVSAKNPRLWPDILNCQARFLAPPHTGEDPPPVLITLADGTSVTSDAPDVDTVVSAFFGRKVLLARTAPAESTIDQYHPDVEGLDPAGHRNTTVEARIGSALFTEEGLPSPVPEGTFFDLFPVSVLATSTLDRLREVAPKSSIDERRFRMNVIVAATGPGIRRELLAGPPSGDRRRRHRRQASRSAVCDDHPCAAGSTARLQCAAHARPAQQDRCRR